LKFVFADSLDFVDPGYDFVADRNARGRTVHRDDQFPHEFLEEAPYDGILVSRGIVGDAGVPGKYTEAQGMRFRREGARKFLRYPEDKFPGSMLIGDCGAFTYREMKEPPYRADDTVEFYGDAGFTHGCSPDHLIFDFDDRESERTRDEVPRAILDRYEVTLQNATEYFAAAKRLGPHFTPLGVIQGWSAQSMATAAAELSKIGYGYLALGGTVPLKIDQLVRALAAIRSALAPHTRLHVLGFGKIESLAEIERFGVASFDTTSPLLRAFKDARKNYWARSPSGGLTYYTAIRVPQAIENNRLKHKALEGGLNQEEAKRLEEAALTELRRFARREADLETTLAAILAYWVKLNWNDEKSPALQKAALVRQRDAYAQTLGDRPWEQCDCRVCRESGIEALIFRSSNRNKRRGIHNLHVFHNHLRDFRETLA
jgi:hypothetical protein